MDKDFKVYIANLGKYNEGELVGGWFEPPIDFDEVKEKIGLNEFYEEYAIHDTDGIPYSLVGEYCSIDEINEIYDMVEALPDYILNEIETLVGQFGSLEELYNHRDSVLFFDGTLEDYARYMIDDMGVLGEIPERLANYIDYDAYAREMKTLGVLELPSGIYETTW